MAGEEGDEAEGEEDGSDDQRAGDGELPQLLAWGRDPSRAVEVKLLRHDDGHCDV